MKNCDAAGFDLVCKLLQVAGEGPALQEFNRIAFFG